MECAIARWLTSNECFRKTKRSYRSGTEQSGECVALPVENYEPQEGYKKCQWKTGWFDQKMKQQDVHQHGAKDCQAQRYVAVRKQQNAANRLDQKDRHQVVGNEQGAKELSCQSCGRGHRNEVQKS